MHRASCARPKAVMVTQVAIAAPDAPRDGIRAALSAMLTPSAMALNRPNARSRPVMIRNDVVIIPRAAPHWATANGVITGPIAK